MSLILNIDTATETAQVDIAEDGIVLQAAFNTDQKEHASFLQPAIKNILQSTGININKIDAIAVTTGPGSYTGLRVAMASAKGLCYALNKPLIGIGTLELLASSRQSSVIDRGSSVLFCPMIDARRMEVFTAVYDLSLKTILEPCALVLEQHYFDFLLANHQIIFFGNGSIKWKLICQNKNALFEEVGTISAVMSKLSAQKYSTNNFLDVAYCEPDYLKNAYIK